MWHNIRWMWRGAQLMLLAIVLVRLWIQPDAGNDWISPVQSMMDGLWEHIQSSFSIAQMNQWSVDGMDRLKDTTTQMVDTFTQTQQPMNALQIEDDIK